MSNALPLTIESLVAVLLLFTILYCVRLNGQLKRLKGDEFTMQKTIGELVTATETAERAISNLKTTVRDADQSLGNSLQLAERYSTELHRNIAAGSEVLHRLTQIAEARPTLMTAPDAKGAVKAAANVQDVRAAKPVKAPPPDPKAIAAAAQAFTERAQARSRVIAA